MPVIERWSEGWGESLAAEVHQRWIALRAQFSLAKTEVTMGLLQLITGRRQDVILDPNLNTQKNISTDTQAAVKKDFQDLAPVPDRCPFF